MGKQLPAALPLQTRAMVVERETLAQRAAGDERVPISLSSDEPVQRFFGREILNHDREAVDLSYAREGLPFLVNHDTDRQVGLIEDVTLGGDGKLRGAVRFSRSPLAQEIRQDIEDGIRRNISVGYRIDALKLDSSDESGDTFRATRWTPMEGSTVPVPADITVGVGRNADAVQYPVRVEGAAHGAPPADTRREAGDTTMSDMSTTPASAAAGGVQVGESREDQGKALGNLARQFDALDLLPDALANGWNAGTFAQKIGERNQAKAAKAVPPGHVDLTAKEQQTFSIIRAMNAALTQDWSKAGFEAEVSKTVATATGRTSGGNRIYLPMNLSTRASVTGQAAGTNSLGGFSVETQIQPLIELLRNKVLVKSLGARVISGLTGNIAFPRQLTANTLNWTGENPTAANTLGNATFEQMTMSPKTAMVSTAYSRQWLIQSSFDANAFVLDDIAQVVARGLDLAALNGSGSSNQPTGIFALSGTSSVSMGSNGGVPTWAKLIEFETDLATSNADTGNIAFLTTPGIRGALKALEKTTQTTGSYLWDDDQTMNGYRAEVTNQVPSNFTTGTATTVCHGMIFGNWSELLIGEWGGALELIVDPYSVAGQNMIAVHAIAMIDINARHPASFVISKSAKTS